jgi:hypothetical protein
MPIETVPNSAYLGLFGYHITNQPTVQTAYGINSADIGAPTYGLNVALVLPRANEPTFLAEDWATRQQTIAQLNSTNSLWPTFGADQQQFNSVKQQVTSLGLKVIESSDTTGGSYVTSAESRTIWVEIDDNADFQLLFSSQAQLQQWTDPTNPNNNFLFWNGSLSLPTEWGVSGLYVDLSQDIPVPSNLAPSAGPVGLPQGPQGIGNATSQPVASVPPQTIAQGYDFPLNGQAVQTPAIALLEPGIGSALPSTQTQSFQQLLDQYLAAVGVTGSGQVYTQGADGQLYDDDDADERSLDVGTIAGVNPNSNIGLYVGSGGNGWAQSDVVTALQSAIWDSVNKPAVISSSFGSYQFMWPNSPFYAANRQLFIDAALQNQTVVWAAGDGGSSSKIGNGLTNLFYNAMSAYSIVVGGTSLSSLTTALTDPTLDTQIIQPALAGNLSAIWQLVAGGLTSLPANAALQSNFVESVWNQYYVQGQTVGGYLGGKFIAEGYTVNLTGAGGVDPTQGVPSYQSAYGLNPVSPDPQAAVGRGAPDVAALAGGNLFYLVPVADMTGTSANGGTSAATPLWATLVAQLDAIFADQGLPPQLGYMNDLLYTASAIAPASFNDITLGNNISSFVAGQGAYVSGSTTLMPTGFGVYAGPGYDLVTGLGSPNGTLLARALTAIAHEQMYFDSVPDVLDQNGGNWSAGVNQTLSFLGMADSGITVDIGLGGSTIAVTSVGASDYAWTSRLAEQVLQPDFDPALVRLLDKQSQAFATQQTVAFGESVSVEINGSAAQAVQGSLTADFGFADFQTSQGVVRVAQAVMVAETAGGTNDVTAIARIRQNGADNLAVTFYKVDDYTGTIGGLQPGSAGYAAAAQAHAYRLSSGGTSIDGPGYGNYQQTGILNVDAGDLIAQMLTNRTTGQTYWSFAQANADNAVHQWNYGLNTVGWEDRSQGSDFDFNDLVVGVDFTSTYGSGWLV